MFACINNVPEVGAPILLFIVMGCACCEMLYYFALCCITLCCVLLLGAKLCYIVMFVIYVDTLWDIVPCTTLH